MDGDVTLLRPFWLLALPGIALLALWLWRRGAGAAAWQRAARPELLAAMTALGRVTPAAGRMPLWVALSLPVIIVIALAGPAVERRDAPAFRNLDGVLFVVDVSEGVTGSQGWPDLQMTARFALGALGSRPGGLIVYAGDAYEAVDMTGDLRELGQTLSLLEAGTVPDPGARPDRALMLAAHVLRGAEVIAGDVLVFTDGSGLGPETRRAATELKAAGARLTFVALRDVSPQMQSHAALTGGQVFGADEVNALTDWLAQSARPRLERQGYPLLFWHDLGRYLLAFGLLPLLWLFRRGAA